MDQESVLQQFDFLTQKIELLIEACKQRENENADLKRQMEQLISQLQEKEVIEKRDEELKALVKTKIDSLMGRLSEFTEE